MRLSEELVRLAKNLLAGEVTLSKGDDYHRVIGDAIRTGDTVTFLYTKKDGSSRQVRIQPSMLIGVKGVRGVDLDDPARTPKVFMFEGIGGGERTVRPIEPKPEVQALPEVIVLRGNETQNELESIFRKAIKLKIPVKMEYVARHDGIWTRKEIQEIPRQYGEIRNGRELWKGVKFVNGTIVPWSIIGEYNAVVRRWEKIDEEKKLKELRTGEALKQLIGLVPKLEHRLSSGQHKEIEEAWMAITGNGTADIIIDKDRNVIDGPYGAMENTKVQDVIYRLIIRSGEPMDKNRMSIESEYGDEYWVDDEGNRSRGDSGYGGGGYSHHRRYNYHVRY